MYGGHITDDWDRRLCKSYMQVYMHPDQIDSELFLAPGYPVPPNLDYKVSFFKQINHLTSFSHSGQYRHPGSVFRRSGGEN